MGGKEPRYLLVAGEGTVDTVTGEIVDICADVLLRGGGGGVIAGRNLYPVLAPVVDHLREDRGWTIRIHAQEQRTSDPKRPRGIIYISHLIYRFPKNQVGSSRGGAARYSRRPSVKWLVLNLELFTESHDIAASAKALVQLARRRGVGPRYSPGSLGSALLRASPAWEQLRRPAPWFISEKARTQLPGNYYARRHGYRKVSHAYYLDQRSSHHTIASQIVLPHPGYLRARGRFRAVEAGRSPGCYDDYDILSRHVGLLVVNLQCGHLPANAVHLYPEWARDPGIHQRWIWTPELRLLDERVRISSISAALTSIQPDLALREYANWALRQLSVPHDPIIKPTLLAAYGMLAVRSDRPLRLYESHGRQQPRGSDLISLPLLDRVFRSTINRRRVPGIQNVVARGVIEAEVKTRSIELARRLEAEGIHAVHIYADGIIARTDQLPFLPPDWRVITALRNVSSPAPHAILSDELVRLPGIPNGRRSAYLRKDLPGEAAPGERSSLHLRENEPNLLY